VAVEASVEFSWVADGFLEAFLEIVGISRGLELEHGGKHIPGLRV